MNKPWTPEITIDADRARQLITAQLPHLQPLDVRYISAGWDNAVFLVNNRLAFRFPLRTIAGQLIENERIVLAVLAVAHLPVSIPTLRHTCEPTAHYPWRFLACDWISGSPLNTEKISPQQLTTLAIKLAHFLKHLHALPADSKQALGIPLDTIKRMDVAHRLPQLHERMQRFVSTGHINDLKPLIELAESTPTQSIPTQSPPSQPLCIVHGDLHPQQLIVDEHNHIKGIIDWGDSHRGHPAVDLATACFLFPATIRQHFWDAYGPVDPTTRQLARFRALCITLALLDQAIDTHNTTTQHEAAIAIQNIHSE